MSSSNSKSSDLQSADPARVEAVESPCRRQCCLDDHDECLGCGRTLAEILEWGKADGARRRQICQAAQQRLRPPLRG
ncbi:DUF1289 domain-containing protein [Aquipseudomonas guryensis]|uniref:DUF1289 domain-containing protein n=1 Tax=Aquipseudomonas guryensis TaxID=2759165 RepID=A0A7W4D991_9GAMM|nr:DUF1289 domain-containing protein [Pseudomonas guryensis]MBB1518356.1 DUF1289 domain-containing protein [Pseudomonas guryensis]